MFLVRHASASARTGSSMPSVVSWNVPKCMPMLSGRLEVEMRLHRLRRIHVNALHEPARLVGADRQQRQIDRAEPAAGCRGRSGAYAVSPAKKIRRSPDASTKPPQSARLRSNGVRAEKCCAGVSVIGSGTRRRVLPPVELLDPANAGRSHQTRRFPAASRRCGSKRSASARSVAQIAVIVVVVAEQHDRDRRQVVEANGRLPHAPRPEQVQRTGALGIDRVGEDVAGRASESGTSSDR